MEELNVAGDAFERKVEFIERLLDNMQVKHQSLGQAGYLLAGDVGVGKTSFVRDFATLLGLKLVMIETPHLVEEHIISIPFIVFENDKMQKRTTNVEATTDYQIKLAKSNLHSEISAAKKLPDAQVLSNIKKRADDLGKIYELLGGSVNEIPPEIKEIRAKYDCILFLDEYFRQTSTSIRNMLRSILNGKIGGEDIPPNVYVLFASNLVDEGIGEILNNEDFKMIEFEAPSVEEFFTYLESKFKNDEHVHLNATVIDRFKKLFKKNAEKLSLSMDDLDADVRISPRRWEQLLLYVNSSLPVKDEAEAKKLLTNVEVNFRNYKTGEKSKILDLVKKVVIDLIKETSDVSVLPDDALPSTEWRDVLMHQIEQKIKLGEHRKYVPVISGLPGSGKTSHIKDLAIDLNMVPVFIDCQNLSPEEVIGIPLSKSRGSDDIEVKFSTPPLYDMIMKQIKQGEAHLQERLTALYGAEEARARLKEYKSKKFKYLLFFDELNRASTKVFNALRRVILEKSFSDGHELPEGSVIVAAINPTSNGTNELTKHLRDVLDIIPAGLSWNKFKNHLKQLKLTEKVKNPKVVDIVDQVLTTFVDKFRAKNASGEGDPHFFFPIGSTTVYISPRELNDLVVNAAKSLDRAFTKVMRQEDRDDFMEFAENELRKNLYTSFEHTLSYILKVKHAVDSPEFMSTLKEWFMNSDDIDVVGKMFTKQVKSVKPINVILDSVFDDHEKNLYDNIEFINYINAVEPQRFKEDLEEYLREKIEKDVKNQYAILRDKKLPRKVMQDEEVKVADGEVSKLEFVTREIVHALKMHKLSNQMFEMVKLALRQLMADFVKDDFMADFLSFNSAITKLIREI